VYIVDVYFRHPNFDFGFFLCLIDLGLGRAGGGRMIVFCREFGVLFGHVWRVGMSGLDSGLGVSGCLRGWYSTQVVLIL
jgi:hypothetical protein